eukprot:TRINITY_DN7147_c0_g1_i1.p1 TRINITY_DN7147_c0_g1~~TRINITY_DN7147_c0_g1_i1.p1  ORF type:complete len:804 (-),score=114.00 TRINITY_DN7147_c0_g1_i1:45-2255(-)
MYPMLCYCDKDTDKKPCFCTGDGHQGRLPWRTTFLYGGPIFGWMALKYHKDLSMKKFYTDDYPAASLSVIALAQVLSVLIDAFTDPGMAKLTDNWTGKWGRRKPFLCFSMIFVPAVFTLSWIVPVKALGASIWYTVFHIGFKLADTAFMIPWEGWGCSVTPIYQERTRLFMVRGLLENCGILCGAAIFPVVFGTLFTTNCDKTPNDGCERDPVIAVVLGALFALACFNLLWFGRDVPLSVLQKKWAQQSAERQSLVKERFTPEDVVPTLMSTSMNKPFRLVLIGMMVKAVGQDVPFKVMAYVAGSVIGEKFMDAGTTTQLYAGVTLITGLLSTPLWFFLASRFGKFWSYQIYNMSVAVTSLLFVTTSEDDGSGTWTFTLLAIIALWGTAYGGSWMTQNLMTDVIDYDHLLTRGLQRESSYMMCLEFVPKFMSIPGEVVPLMMMAVLGYLKPPSESSSCSTDADCSRFFLDNPSACRGSGEQTCSELQATAGIEFVCSLLVTDTTGVVTGQCLFRQNADVRRLLVACLSIVPFCFILLGYIALTAYPKEARTERGHEEVMHCATLVKRGISVEDPWAPGNWITPLQKPSVPVPGALSYIPDSDLRDILNNKGDDGSLDFGSLRNKLLLRSIIYVTISIIGVVVFFLPGTDFGTTALFSTDEQTQGRSLSPLGSMIFGFGLVLFAFHFMQYRAVSSLRDVTVDPAAVQYRIDLNAPFLKKTSRPGSSSSQIAPSTDLE